MLKSELGRDYLHNYATWDRYMALIWSNLLEACSLHTGATVIEIAPGASTKIGLALKNLNFKGQLYVVEPSPNAIEQICIQYENLCPEVRIIPIQKSLKQSSKELPLNPDFIVANHPLDDMLMFHQASSEDLFNWTLAPVTQLNSDFVEHWKKLNQNPAQLQTAQKEIIHEWMELIHILNPQCLLLSQYPSITLKKNNLDDLNERSKDILQELQLKLMLPEQTQFIQNTLDSLKNVEDTHILEEVLNAKNWLYARSS